MHIYKNLTCLCHTNKKHSHAKRIIPSFPHLNWSSLGRCVPPLFVYFGKEGLLSTCLYRVNKYRLDSCQRCPSTLLSSLAKAAQYTLTSALLCANPTEPRSVPSYDKQPLALAIDLNPMKSHPKDCISYWEPLPITG